MPNQLLIRLNAPKKRTTQNWNNMNEKVNFLPTTRREMEALGWSELDILLITGDCYVDHPSFGVSLIGRWLMSFGYKVGLIPQFDWNDPTALQVMGRPRLGCGVTSGNLDSMVNIYTAGRRLRKDDAYSEDGQIGKRPAHALIVYAQLAKRAFTGIPVVLGGLEASFRRVAHYDYWQDKIRPSVLVDSKADILCYGMGERPMPEIFRRLDKGESLRGIPGTAVLLGKKDSLQFNPEIYDELPTYEEHLNNRDALMTSTIMIEQGTNAYAGRGLFQRYGDRILVLEPPPLPLTTEELDKVHDLDYSYAPHPRYKGRIPAFETIRDSIPAVRGCPGGCAFCGLVSHQGRHVVSRSAQSIIRNVKTLCSKPEFHGTISDIGGAAGNIYGSKVLDVERCRRCRRASCLCPTPCPNYQCDGQELLKLLREVDAVEGVKHLYINSGIRLDLALKQPELLRELIQKHVSGHLKVAPEHLNPYVLKLMRKSSAEEFYQFMRIFDEESKACGKEQYLIPLFISNFPGCTEAEMKDVDDFLDAHKWSPQQVQDYIPLPLTMGCAMYYTGKAPDGSEITVNRGLKERRTQINMLKKQRSKGAGVKPAGFRPRGGNGQSTERRGRSSDTAERNFRDMKK